MHLLYRGVFFSESKFISIIVFIRSYIIFQVFWKILEAVILVSLIAFGGRFFKILPSIPGALLFFVLSIMFLISCAVVLGMVYSLSVEVIVVCASSSVWHLRLIKKTRYRHIFVEFQTLSSFLLLKINNMLEQVVFTLKTLCFIVNWYACSFHSEDSAIWMICFNNKWTDIMCVS